mmetsp:Transcript_2346/g.4137  ORF Transcript_2346/g.4137 Transcript_2346/m.4137 type:complete len:239 (-) Transcript_2346:775-1491(-)
MTSPVGPSSPMWRISMLNASPSSLSAYEPEEESPVAAMSSRFPSRSSFTSNTVISSSPFVTFHVPFHPSVRFLAFCLLNRYIPPAPRAAPAKAPMSPPVTPLFSLSSVTAFWMSSSFTVSTISISSPLALIVVSSVSRWARYFSAPSSSPTCTNVTVRSESLSTFFAASSRVFVSISLSSGQPAVRTSTEVGVESNPRANASFNITSMVAPMRHSPFGSTAVTKSSNPFASLILRYMS